MEHANAPFTPNGRLRMVLLVEDQKLTFEQAAACSGVSKSTVWEWVWRWRRVRRSSATSGLARVTCCTWTSSALSA
jgi:transposase